MLNKWESFSVILHDACAVFSVLHFVDDAWTVHSTRMMTEA